MAGVETGKHPQIEAQLKHIRELARTLSSRPEHRKQFNSSLYNAARGIFSLKDQNQYQYAIMQPEPQYENFLDDTAYGSAKMEYDGAVNYKKNTDDLMRRFMLNTVRDVISLSQSPEFKGTDVLALLGVRLVVMDIKGMTSKSVGIEVYDVENPENPENPPIPFAAQFKTGQLGLNLSLGEQKALIEGVLNPLAKNGSPSVAFVNDPSTLSADMRWQLFNVAWTEGQNTNWAPGGNSNYYNQVVSPLYDSWLEVLPEGQEEVTVVSNGYVEEPEETKLFLPVEPEVEEVVVAPQVVSVGEEHVSSLAAALDEAVAKTEAVDPVWNEQITRSKEYKQLSEEGFDYVLHAIEARFPWAKGRADLLIDVLGFDNAVVIEASISSKKVKGKQETEVKRGKIVEADAEDKALVITKDQQPQRIAINGKFLRLHEVQGKIQYLNEKGEPIAADDLEVMIKAFASVMGIQDAGQVKGLLRLIFSARTKSIAELPPIVQPVQQQRRGVPVPADVVHLAPAEALRVESGEKPKSITIKLGSFQQGSSPQDVLRLLAKTRSFAAAESTIVPFPPIASAESPDFSERSLRLVDPATIQEILAGKMTRAQLETIVPQISTSMIHFANEIDREAMQVAKELLAQVTTATHAQENQGKPLFFGTLSQHILAPYIAKYIREFSEGNAEIFVDPDTEGSPGFVSYPMEAVALWIMRYEHPVFLQTYVETFRDVDSPVAQTFLAAIDQKDPGLFLKLRMEGKITLADGRELTLADADKLLIDHNFYSNDFVNRAILAQAIEEIYPIMKGKSRVGEGGINWSAAMKPLAGILFGEEEVIRLLTGKNLYATEGAFDRIAHRAALEDTNRQLRKVIVGLEDIRHLDSHERTRQKNILQAEEKRLRGERTELRKQAEGHVVARFIQQAINERIAEYIGRARAFEFDDKQGDGSHAVAYMRVKKLYDTGHWGVEPLTENYVGGESSRAYQELIHLRRFPTDAHVKVIIPNGDLLDDRSITVQQAVPAPIDLAKLEDDLRKARGRNSF